MERRTAFFFANGLAASSRKTYKAGENRYIGFCQRYSIVPLPVSESGLCKFVTYLVEQGLKYRTIKTYLSGTRYLHIRSGLQDPFHGVHITKLEYTTRGIKRFQAQSMAGGRTRLLLPREHARSNNYEIAGVGGRGSTCLAQSPRITPGVARWL